jgi:hypothetical protein
MKFATDRPYTDPEKAARKLVKIANSVEPAREAAFSSNWSTRRFSTSTRRARLNTTPASRSPSRAAG